MEWRASPENTGSFCSGCSGAGSRQTSALHTHWAVLLGTHKRERGVRGQALPLPTERHSLAGCIHLRRVEEVDAIVIGQGHQLLCHLEGGKWGAPCGTPNSQGTQRWSSGKEGGASE